MKNNAQIRMGETIAVLIIFFFLIVIGVAFYMNVSKSSIAANMEEMIAQDSIKIAQAVSFMPELQCSSENIVDDNCYDLYKIGPVTKVVNTNRLYYLPFFSTSTIIISQLYPTKKEWLLYNFTGNRTAAIYTYIPISLYNATTKKYSFGVLNIGYFPYYG